MLSTEYLSVIIGSARMDEKNSSNAQIGAIVVVDGDETSRAESVRMLKEAGYVVHGFAAGGKALKFCEEQQAKVWKLALVAIDLKLSDVSGFEMIRRFQDMADKYKAPVIMTGRYVTPEDEIEASNAGAFRMVKRPIDAESVSSVLEAVKMKELKASISSMVFDIDYS